MVDINSLRPVDGLQELDLTLTDNVFTEQRELVNQHLNNVGARHFIDLANEADIDPDTGMQYLMVGPRGYSAEEVIIAPGTFANGLWPHIIARGEAIADTAQRSGVFDSNGVPLGVLLVGSPCMSSKFNLNSEERSQVANGNFNAIANRHARLLAFLGFGAVRGVFYSQAAAHAAPFINIASKFLDVNNMIVGEYPINRVGFIKERQRFSGERKKDSVDVIEKLFGSGQAAERFELGIVRRLENLAIIRGIGDLVLTRDLLQAGTKSKKTTMLHAMDSLVSPAADIISAFDGVKAMMISLGLKNRFTRIQVDSNHSFGDRVSSYSAVVAANLAD